jgi:hypothetical protein
MWSEWCLQTSNDQMLNNYCNQGCADKIVSTGSHVELSVASFYYLISQNGKWAYNFFIECVSLKWVMRGS